MKAKQYLLKIRMMHKEINRLQKEMDNLRDKLYHTTATASDVVVQSGGSDGGSRDSKIIDKLVDYENELKKEMDSKILQQLECRKLINELDEPVHRMVLLSYYVDCERHNKLKTYEDVARELGYSVPSIDLHLKKAVKAFEQVYLKLS